MGYLFLAAALLANTAKGFFGKKTSGYTQGLKDAMLANMIRMLLCVFIGLGLILLEGNAQQLKPSASLLAVSALSGVSTAVLVVTWLICVKRSAFMMLDVFLMLGVLIPLSAGSIFFHEPVTIAQWLGMAVLLVAVVIMCSYNNSIKEKLSLTSLLLLVLCGAANGVADLSQKLFVKALPTVAVSVFQFYSYLFAGAALVIVWFLCKPHGQAAPPAAYKKIALYILAIAVCLFANAYFKTLAAEHLDAVLLYPLNQGMALIASTAMSSALFGERLNARAVAGIVLAFAGLIIINVL